MNYHEPLDPQQQRIALLALGVTQPVNDEVTCPGDTQLTAFIEHRLTDVAREAMLYHLNRCPTCYQVWLDTVEALQDEEPASIQQPITSRQANRWQRLLTLVNRLADWRPRLTIPVTAVAVLAGMLLWWPWTPLVTEQIDAQFETLPQQPSTELAVLMKAIPLPWERAALGFSAEQPSPSELAFGAGLWVGRAELLAEHPRIALPEFLKPATASSWQEGEWAAHYHAGRWIVLLWTLTQSIQPNVDWSTHLEILETLKGQLAEQEANELPVPREIQLLASLEPLLEDLVSQDGGAQRIRLGRRLEVLIQQLMSVSI